MFNEYDVVKLKRELPGNPIPLGAKGTVLMVFGAPTEGYEVEFMDRAGNSLGVFTVHPNDIELSTER